MIAKATREWWVSFLASVLAFPTLAFPQLSSRRRAEARLAYDRAVQLQTALESRPEDAREKADYLRVIRAFREVYGLNPASKNTPVALETVAKLYEEMGRVFSSDRSYLDAINAYQFLLSEYPKSPGAREALYAMAEIYRSDLENLEEARKAYEQFLERHPKSAKAEEVREKLKQIDRSRAERLEEASGSRRAVAGNRPATLSAEVVAIRRWVGPSYTRIVIGLDGEAKFDTIRLANPDRIVLDLSNSRLNPALAGKAFPVEGGYLRQIRAAQFKPNVTRVVLDVEKIEDYSIFTLPNPFRLVIDIHGTATALPGSSTAKGASPAGNGLPATGAPRGSTSASVTPTSGASASTHPIEETKGTAQPTATIPGKETKREMRETTTQDGSSKETASVRFPAPRPAGNRATGSGASTSREKTSLATPAAPTESGGRTLTRALGLKIGRVVIDAGHGGHDTGTIGPTGVSEKDVVLDVALRLKKLLERSTDSSVILTRGEDTFVPLEERTAIANQNAADLFISIHANASRDRSARGVETYYLNFTSNPEALEVAARENATSQESVHQLQDLIKKIALTEKVEESHEFAQLVQKDMHHTLARSGSVQKDRGVKRAPFVVLIGANMPSVLSEISFLTNPRDERLLKRPDYRQKIAEGLYQGTVHYMNSLAKMTVAGQTRPPRQESTAQRTSPTGHPDF